MKAAAQAAERRNLGMSLSRRFRATEVTRPFLRHFSTTRRAQDGSSILTRLNKRDSALSSTPSRPSSPPALT